MEEPGRGFLNTREMTTTYIKMVGNLEEKKNADLLLALFDASLLQ